VTQNACLHCICESPSPAITAGRLVLATNIEHTVGALRSLARRRGDRLTVLAPGVLELVGDRPDLFVAAARDELSSVEADEVHCIVAPKDSSELELFAQAMRAPSLRAVGARVGNGEIASLFDNELKSFYCVYQPIVDLMDGKVVAHEALLRATTVTGTPVFPDELFAAADLAGWTGLVDRIGRTTALRQAGPWLGDDELFINFVPSSIYRPEVCLRTTEQASDLAGLRLDQLVFEVTESHQVTDVHHLDRVFQYYRERGCRVALDDLGAGYSSLNLLLRLQPDVVKLDKEIVQSLPSAVSVALVTAIVSIVHAYGGKVVAECIETAEQADASRELGADLGQGWYFGRPVRHEPLATGQDRTAIPVTH
jgi:EAL domain-containing protein (putative c-di-GMP-specific phosphodiesterase class I)